MPQPRTVRACKRIGPGGVAYCGADVGASKTDAKNQGTLFEYNTFKCVTRVYGSGYEKRLCYES